MAAFASRVLAGLAAAGLTITAAGAPAFAAAPAAQAVMIVGDVTAPVGPDGARFAPLLLATAPLAVDKPKVTYQLSGDLPGVTLAPPESGGDDCVQVSPTNLTCSRDDAIELGPDDVISEFPAFVMAGAGAQVDDEGELTTTITSPSLPEELKDISRVRVGESANLTAAAPVERSGAPGKAFDAPAGVTNASDKVITGAAVLLAGDYAIAPTKQFSNCLYSDGDLIACSFDEQLKAGSTYRATIPFQIRSDTEAPGSDSVQLQWLTAAELEDQVKTLERHGLELGEPGEGAELALTEATEALQRKAQADPNPGDNFTDVNVEVTGTNGVDLAAIGANLKGAAGTEVTAEVGVHNVGTATLDFGRIREPAAVTTVYAPAGAEIISVPAGCVPFIGDKIDRDKAGEAGHGRYECYSDALFKAGEKVLYRFGFRIDNATSKAGRLTVNEPCECQRFTRDIKKANNEAAITVNKKTDTGGAGGGDDDTLPITGPATGGIAGTGLAMVALGVLALVATRRREVR